MKKYYRIEMDEPKLNWTYGLTAMLGYAFLSIETDFGWQCWALLGFYIIVLLSSGLRIKTRTCKK